ncbi:MAG: hypothetical protein IID33_02375 [Planctomycetes bacterium]|nr:hypothetical protein [Planctomycetota bacterium]
MAIQFACPGCSQPIEVDDEIAGKSAACPYCQRVVTVPGQTTYRPAELHGASPVEPDAPSPIAPPYSATGLHVGPPPDERIRLARRLGNSALVCAALVVVSVVTVTVLAMKIMLESFDLTASQPSQSDVMAALQDSPFAVHMLVSECSSGIFALIGAVAGIASLNRSKRGNWRAWTALVICIGALSCFGLSRLGGLLTGGS